MYLNLELKKKDLIVLASLFAILCACASFTASSLNAFLVLCVVALLWSLQNFLIIWVYRKLWEQSHAEYRDLKENSYLNIEALLSVYASLRPSQPLPSMTGYAASPILASVLINEISVKKTDIVLEVGSGVSTLILAYCFSKRGFGKVISLEHKEEYAAATKFLIKNHKMEEFVEIIYSPLTSVYIEKKEWLWYGLEELQNQLAQNKIDLLVVDGPTYGIQPEARYPALPLLFPYLSSDATVILDDAFRLDEKRVLRKWLSDFSDQFQYHCIGGDRGTAVLRRKGT